MKAELMQDLTRKNLKFNFFVNLADGGFFGFAVGFASYTTIIPLFVTTMTSSPILIGLIPAIHNMGWQLPQLFIANHLSKLERIKPLTLLLTIQERLPILALALVAAAVPKIGISFALVATFLILVWQGLGAGFTANAWQIFIAKIIPSELRATFFGAQSAAANLLSSVGAILAGLILERTNPQWSYVICFSIASVLYLISWLFLNQAREPVKIIDRNQLQIVPLWSNVIHILKTDKFFRNFLVSRFLSQFGMMATAFYTVYAVSNLGVSPVMIGVMTSVLLITQVLANPILGKISDKWSRKWVLVMGSAASILSALLAILIKEPGFFAIVFILMGIGNTAYWTIGITISLEFGDEENRPVYVGMANTLVSPSTILAPLLGGFLANSFGYRSTFLISTIFGLIAILIMSILVKDPGRGKPHALI